MSKKLLSVVLALALALSCFAVSAFALGDIGYESEEDAAKYTQAWTLESSNSGNTYTVKVKLDANYGVGPIQFKVLKTVNAGSITLTGATADETDIPENWLADVSFNNTTGEVVVIPHPEEDGVSALDCTGGKYVAILTYTVSDDAAGKLVIDVEDVKSASNPGGTLLAARMSDGNVVTGASIVGQTVSTATDAVTIGNAEEPSTPPTLVAIDGTLGVVDTSRTDLDADNEGTTCNGYLLGFDPDANGSVEELFEVVGDGSMEVVASAAGSEVATGTMVNVLDLDGNVVATYVLIVFGDANGDGVADPTDASIIEEHDAWGYGEFGRLFTYQDFACDVNIDGAADPTDASIIEEHDAWGYGDTGRIDVATILATLGF